MAKIAVIGAGNVGATLGKRLRDAGHTVTWGVRDPEDAKYEGIDVAAVGAAVEGAEIVFLAVPWSAAEPALESAGSVDGKILVDAINPIAQDFSDLANLEGASVAEYIARWTHGASVVKAFNTIGFNIMQNPQFGEERAILPVASDDDAAKKVVMGLAEQLGFEPIDAGPLRMARHLESFAWLWITLALKQGYGRDIAFRLLKR
jgi:predicted dinucleotide-binding enzyme